MPDSTTSLPVPCASVRIYRCQIEDIFSRQYPTFFCGCQGLFCRYEEIYIFTSISSVRIYRGYIKSSRRYPRLFCGYEGLFCRYVELYCGYIISLHTFKGTGILHSHTVCPAPCASVRIYRALHVNIQGSFANVKGSFADMYSSFAEISTLFTHATLLAILHSTTVCPAPRASVKICRALHVDIQGSFADV